jgi:predicted AAA+ superfamily ATPase
METLVVNEVKAYLDYHGLRYPLHFWRNYDGAEVDLLVETRTGYVAVEIKAAQEWQRRFGNGLRLLVASLATSGVRPYGVFRGSRRVDDAGITVLPLSEFLSDLWKGNLIA